MVAASQALDTAMQQLEQAQGEFGGHRKNAEQLVAQAGKEINLAIEANEKGIAEKKAKK
jgi:hypothetical protein